MIIQGKSWLATIDSKLEGKYDLAATIIQGKTNSKLNDVAAIA